MVATKKLYVDTRTQRNLHKLTEELNDVHQVSTTAGLGTVLKYIRGGIMIGGFADYEQEYHRSSAEGRQTRGLVALYSVAQIN